jgi:hypothetical protein
MSVTCGGTPNLSCCLLEPSADCDQFMANYCTGSTEIACNCINSKLPCATSTDPNCSNNSNSYKPYSTSAVCSKLPLCINTFYDGDGSGVDGLVLQICGTTGLESLIFYRYPVVTILLVFIFIILSVYVYKYIKTKW